MKTRFLPCSASMTSLVAAFFTVAVLLTPSAAATEVTLVPTGAVWRYLDTGSNQGTAWRDSAFDDSAWNSGSAELGYGDGGESTVVNSGPSGSYYITTYFRHAFTVEPGSEFTTATLRVLRDDGVAVYLDGAEVFRNNLPVTTLAYTTPASSALGGADETTFVETSLNVALLAEGDHVLAVEIHQSSGTSSDISFDLELLAGNGDPTVTRGPYLQQVTPTSVIVRWRTDAACDSQVVVTDPRDIPTATSDATPTTEHEVLVSGLTPDTAYFYTVGSQTGVLAGGADYVFFTAPSSPRAVRIWALSDYGFGDASSRAVLNGYRSFAGASYTDVWLTMGDNDQTTGTDANYETVLFDTYPAMLRQSAIWPALGNHDMNGSANPPLTMPYFLNFTLPQAGQAGGLPSGTEKYYSFDYAGIHFICLDAMASDRSPTGPMAAWLEADLAGATATQWIIAYWHHPPYTKGTHDSDTEIELVEMRGNILPILEAGGTDLVLCGHSHVYERTGLLDGHYGRSTTLTEAMFMDWGDGRTDGDGAYTKPPGNAVPTVTAPTPNPPETLGTRVPCTWSPGWGAAPTLPRSAIRPWWSKPN
jgi:hypothetical protein